MGKGKPRHNPKKKQNRYGGVCGHYCTNIKGESLCEAMNFHGDVSICKGNPHNCVKLHYRILASHNNKELRTKGDTYR